MPAVAPVMAEEAPSMPVVLVLHQYPHPSTRDSVTHIGTGCHILFPDHREEKGPGAVHDGYIGKSPVAVVFTERFDNKKEERVAGYSAHGIVRDPCGSSLTYP